MSLFSCLANINITVQDCMHFKATTRSKWLHLIDKIKLILSVGLERLHTKVLWSLQDSPCLLYRYSLCISRPLMHVRIVASETSCAHVAYTKSIKFVRDACLNLTRSLFCAKQLPKNFNNIAEMSMFIFKSVGCLQRNFQ